MHLINRHEALTRFSRAITTIERLRKWNGFLLSWYDTSNGHCLTGPGGTDCETSPITGQLISTVDNGWYGAGLVVARQALSETQCRECRDLVRRVTALLNAMNYGVFYDAGNQCADITAGQMYGGYMVDQGPARVPLWPAEHRDPHRRLYGHRHAHHAGRCLVAHLAHAAHDQPARPRPAAARLTRPTSTGRASTRRTATTPPTTIPQSGQPVHRLRGALRLHRDDHVRQYRLCAELGRQRI